MRLRYVVLLAVGALALCLIRGGGEGNESLFSPDSFERRSVRKYAIPFLPIPLVRVPSAPYRGKIIQFWLDEGYLAGRLTEPTRWDLVYGSWAWEGRWDYGPDRAFWSRVCRADEQADEWIAWSRQNPALAARLWPDVIRLLADGDGYYFAGMLIVMVGKTADPKEFEDAYAVCRTDGGPAFDRILRGKQP